MSEQIGIFVKDEIPPNNIIFCIGDEEVLKLSDEGFFYRGEKVEDIHQVYERFNEWLEMARKRC